MSEATGITLTEKPRVMTFVAQTEILFSWLAFATIAYFLSQLALHGGYLQPAAVALGAIAGLAFANYCFTIIEMTARGHDRLPAMSVGFLSDSRAYKAVLLATFLLTILKFTPEIIRGEVLLVAGAITPAITAFLTLENSVLRAINPVSIYRFMATMGKARYVAFRMVTTGFLGISLYFIDDLTVILTTEEGALIYAFSGVYVLLVMSRCTGVLLHSKRTELGFQTYFSEEMAGDMQRAGEKAARVEFLSELRELCRQGEVDEAHRKLNARLQQRRYVEEHLYYEDLREWNDTRLRCTMAKGYLKRLVEESPEQAWRIYADLYDEMRGDFALDSGAAILRLAETAADSRQKRTILSALASFKDDFPKHPRVREACLIATGMACELGDLELAKACFLEVETRPGAIDDGAYERCRKLISRLEDNSNQSG